MNTRDERELLSKPGDSILETIEHLKMTQTELAKRLGKTASKVNDLITGKEPVTATTAFQLEKVLGIDAKFWMNLEMNYKEQLTRIEQEEFLEQCIEWLKSQPYKELKKFGYLKSEKPDTQMVNECLKFYGVESPDQWNTMYVNDYAKTSFRKSTAHTAALSSMAAWLRIGEIGFQKMQLPEYDRDKFKTALAQIKDIIQHQPEDYAIQLQNICRQAGVAVVYTPSLPGAPISGATRWVGGHPVIQLTDRYKTNDQFWFTFFHEAAHVLLHGKKEIFIENFEAVKVDKEKEIEANEYASNYLLSKQFLKNLPEKITLKDIKRIAREYSTHPAIVLAKLQKENIVGYNFGTELKLKVILDEVVTKGGDL